MLLAGLARIPDELYEVAEIDGASRWQRFRHVTLPGIGSVTVAAAGVHFIASFQEFNLVYILTGGGPLNATQTLAIFSFKLSFKLFDFSHGAAVGNILVVISLVFAYFYIRSFRRQLETDASP